MIWVYKITPVAAPRQCLKDAYDPQPRVLRYRAYQDELRLRKASLPRPYHHLLFVLPMPPSWPRSQREGTEGMPHQQKPDRDNLEKAFLDSVMPDDCMIFDGRVTKVWGQMGLIIVSDTDIEIGRPARLTPFYTFAMEERANTIRASHVYSSAHRLSI